MKKVLVLLAVSAAFILRAAMATEGTVRAEEERGAKARAAGALVSSSPSSPLVAVTFAVQATKSQEGKAKKDAPLVIGPLVIERAPDAPQAARKSTKWEYKVVKLGLGMEEKLNEFGDSGWELVAVIGPPGGASSVAYLKRPKQ